MPAKTQEKPRVSKRGMPLFEATDERKYTVELMASIGLRHEHIALAIGCDDKTLRKHFREQLDTGKSKTITKVADSLVRQALAGNMTAAIFYLKTQAGWKETAVTEHVGQDGGPIEHSLDLSKLTKDQIMALASIGLSDD